MSDQWTVRQVGSVSNRREYFVRCQIKGSRPYDFTPYRDLEGAQHSLEMHRRIAEERGETRLYELIERTETIKEKVIE